MTDKQADIKTYAHIIDAERIIDVSRCLDEIGEQQEVIDSLVKPMIDQAVNDENFNGLAYPNRTKGMVSVTKSAKETGKWQVTEFDEKLIPNYDNGQQDKAAAVEYFYSKVSFERLRENALQTLKQDQHNNEPVGKNMNAQSINNSNVAATNAEPKKPTATVYYGKAATVVAQLETNSANAKGKDTALATDSQKLANLSANKQDFNYSLDTLKKSDMKDLQGLKDKGFELAVHDLSGSKNKSLEEKANAGELKNIADKYNEAEVPRAGRTYTGMIMSKGEDTTIQKTPTGKYVAHETANVNQMQASDTHKNQSIKYNTEKQTEIKAVGRDEIKKELATAAKETSSASFER